MRTLVASAADGTLFHVAVRSFGDATAAVVIAQASGLSDPWLDGLTTLSVSDRPGPDTGGLPAPGTTV